MGKIKELYFELTEKREAVIDELLKLNESVRSAADKNWEELWPELAAQFYELRKKAEADSIDFGGLLFDDLLRGREFLECELENTVIIKNFSDRRGA